MSSAMRRTISIFIICCLFMGVFWSQELVEDYKRKGDFIETFVFIPGEAIGGIVLAGFKSIAVDILWIMLDELFHKGHWFKTLPIFHSITYLQPRFIHNWSLGGWHMSFNISHEEKDIEKEREWIIRGIEFMKRGIKYNPDRYVLYFETAFTFYQKAKKFDNTNAFYDEAIRFMRKATRYEHPDYVDRMIAHIFRYKGDWESSCKEWKRIISIRPDDHIARRHLIEAEEKLGYR